MAAAWTRADVERAILSPAAPPRRSDFDLDPGLPRVAAARRPAAVLCPIVERGAGLAVILTLRSEALRHHAGQVSFPGGKVDAGDRSPLATALREAEEEIGLTADLVEVIGALSPYDTATGFSITPFVGFVAPAFRPIPDHGEVAEVFEAPLDFLLDPANRRRGERQWRGAVRRFYETPWRGRHVWGATAGMLKDLSDRLIALRRAGLAAE